MSAPRERLDAELNAQVVELRDRLIATAVSDTRDVPCVHERRDRITKLVADYERLVRRQTRRQSLHSCTRFALRQREKIAEAIEREADEYDRLGYLGADTYKHAARIARDGGAS